MRVRIEILTYQLAAAPSVKQWMCRCFDRHNGWPGGQTHTNGKRNLSVFSDSSGKAVWWGLSIREEAA
jgi:hypothetical protein